MSGPDRERLMAGLRALAAVFKTELTVEVAELYALAFEDEPITTIEAGFKRCLKECTFFPVPAEILEHGKPPKRHHEGQPPSFGPGHWAWEKAELEARETRARARITCSEPEPTSSLIPATLNRLAPERRLPPCPPSATRTR